MFKLHAPVAGALDTPAIARTSAPTMKIYPQ